MPAEVSQRRNRISCEDNEKTTPKVNVRLPQLR